MITRERFIQEEIKLGLKGLPEEERSQIEFCKKYSVEILGEGQIKFTLPVGARRIDLLNEVQAFALKFLRQPAVSQDYLDKWANDPDFTREATEDSKDRTIIIDGNVSKSTKMSRAEQEKNGWNNAKLCDVAAAHAAYLITTRQDLFNKNMVRVLDGMLSFSEFGLRVLSCHPDNARESNIAASSAFRRISWKRKKAA